MNEVQRWITDVAETAASTDPADVTILADVPGVAWMVAKPVDGGSVVYAVTEKSVLYSDEIFADLRDYLSHAGCWVGPWIEQTRGEYVESLGETVDAVSRIYVTFTHCPGDDDGGTGHACRRYL
ncbi:hypothetical protein [Saccharomonospora sp. CUA-673]|uniref:hypothetical protein n=1 Tax=Saccharomonospora sp. CUA-673 TaxID=1904969 RepID=UPI0011153D1E|nr:hypothetical protein [Saccharomonospora sp. CUA-673]